MVEREVPELLPELRVLWSTPELLLLMVRLPEEEFLLLLMDEFGLGSLDRIVDRDDDAGRSVELRLPCSVRKLLLRLSLRSVED